jgi:hypothetical protein
LFKVATTIETVFAMLSEETVADMGVVTGRM